MRKYLVQNDNKIDGLYLALMINRIQIIYFLLFFIRELSEPYDLLLIISIGIINHLTIKTIGKWYKTIQPQIKENEFFLITNYPKKILGIAAFLYLLIAQIWSLLKYVNQLQTLVYPNFDMTPVIIIILLLGLYLAKQGLLRTIRFIVPVFIIVAPTIFLSVYFLFGPDVHLWKLYPIIPYSWNGKDTYFLIKLLSSLQIPLLTLFLVPYLEPTSKTFRWVKFANIYSTFELFISHLSALLFLGYKFLRITYYPMNARLRFIVLPFLERIDIIYSALLVIVIIFISAMLLLMMNDSLKIIVHGTRSKELNINYVFIFSFFFYLGIYKWFWQSETYVNMWNYVFLAISFPIIVIVPIYLWYVTKRGGLKE